MKKSRLVTDRVVADTFVRRVEHHATISSTNDRARERAGEAGVELPLLVVADRQTAGRGRGTNRWWTGPGSLALSLLLPGERPTSKPAGPGPLAALAAAVAIVETIRPLLPDGQSGIDRQSGIRWQSGIHWPNDVFVARRKLSGILAEVLPDGRCVLGIGINTNSRLADAPEELRSSATTLREILGRPVDATALLIDLLQRLEHQLSVLADDPRKIGRRADRMCLQHGKPLALRQGRRTVDGMCEGIAPDGALLLKTSQGTEAFYSGTLVLCHD